METTLVGAAQPDLVAAVPAARRAEATQATRAAAMRLRLGPWAADELHGPPGHLGLLVLEGLLSREVQVAHRSCVELLGAGDVVRPWDALTDDSSIAIDARWTVQSEVRMAVLDRAFALQIGRFPEVTSALMNRLVRRSRWLAFHLAVCHLPQLSVRLRVVLWYMADRWGRVTPDGVLLPLRLSHELLGGLVGATRSPVTRAVGRLRRAGELRRLPDATWLLTGERPTELPEIHDRAAGVASVPSPREA
jgi:CRP/FNR family transcriptional regulator, cyclic AMP receptor protein